jgi:hypothetical protein
MHEGGDSRCGKFGLVRVAQVDEWWQYTQQVPSALGRTRSQFQIDKEAHVE